MVGMSQEQSALFWQSLAWKFVLRTGLVKESICDTSPSLLQTFGETCWRVGVSAIGVARHTRGSAILPIRARDTCLRRATPTPRHRRYVSPNASACRAAAF